MWTSKAENGHSPSMKKQIHNRLGVAHVRDTLEQFVAGILSREQAMESLQIGHSRLYKLRASYLAARASGAAAAWKPRGSGGNRKGEWAADEQAFLLRALVPPAGAKPYSYAYAASEFGRRFGHAVDRGRVRHWAVAQGVRPAVPQPRPSPTGAKGKIERALLITAGGRNCLVGGGGGRQNGGGCERSATWTGSGG